MPVSNARRLLLALVACCLATAPSQAITVDLQWDTSSEFYTNSTARNAIQAAADDIGYWIIEPLSGINQGTFYYDPSPNPGIPRQQYKWEEVDTTSNQTLTATYGWNYEYSTSSGTEYIFPEQLAANTVKIFVDGEGLSGSTLGTGGPVGSFLTRGYNISLAGSISQPVLQTQFTYLTDELSGRVEGDLRRGGPVISEFSGITGIDFGGGNSASAPYSISVGPAYGRLTLDTSWGSETMDQYWHLDHTEPVAAGKNDLYSVALHEMLHALGVGSSVTWDSLRNGSTWLGGEASAENGTGVNLVLGNHVAPNIMSTNVNTGADQESVMDPDLTQGKRKQLTTLDLAFLRDIGYATRDVPTFSDPGDFNDDGIVNLADYTLWRDNLGASTEAAINSNGDGGGITIADYTVWKDHFGMNYNAGSLAEVAVPEPSSLLLACGGLFLFARSALVARSAGICCKH